METTIGWIVHYTLNGSDAQIIKDKRQKQGGQQNTAHAGDVYPAIVVRTWHDNMVNLKVFLDGDDSYWATSRVEGEGNGTWAWPSRA